MSYQNAYSAYRDTNVRTASQGRLVVLLYEEAVRQLTMALQHFNAEGKVGASEIEKFTLNIRKTQEIITELQVSLDMEKGGQLSQHLMSLYVYFNSELLDASITHSREKVSFVLNMMRELLESWRTICNSTANAPAQAVQSALNIQG